MVDSIIFKVYDLQLHKELVQFLYKPEARTGKELQHVELTETEQDLEIHKRVWHGRQFRDFTSGKITRFNYRDFLKSSNYDISFAIGSDFIEFNISVPKYLYGTNVFQFLPHRWDKNYTDFFATDKNLIRELVFKRFVRFMTYFFKKHLGGLVDQRLVEYMRIDLAFVKVFYDKETAISYLAQLKRIAQKHWRDDPSKVSSYGSTIYYKTREYTFKIYHKGAEFKKNDGKEIKKLIKKNLVTHDEIQEIQSVADRMVRYEMEFRNSYINRIHKSRRGIPEFNFTKLDLKRARSLNVHKYYSKEGKKIHWHELSRNEKKFFREANKEFVRTYAVALEKYPGEKRVILLDKELFVSMLAVLGRAVNHFTVKSSNEFMGLAGYSKEKFMHHVRTVLLHTYKDGANLYRNISYSRMRMLFEFLEKYNFKQIVELGLFERTTLYTYRRVLKALKVGEVISPEKFREYDNHFKEYYTLVNYHAGNINILRAYRPIV